MTTAVHLEHGDYWARCACGYSMRVPSPNDSMDRTQMPVFCTGCGKRIVYTGRHPWLPHAFEPRGKATMNWGGLKIGDQLPGCNHCWRDKRQHTQWEKSF